MTAATAKRRPARAPGETQITIDNRTGKTRKTVTVKFGSVTVKADAPSEEEVARNIARGAEAFERGLKRLLKPGVKIRPKKGIPLFQSDPDNPERLIRLLDGKREKGFFEGREFRVIE
jgi:hypothetical protein